MVLKLDSSGPQQELRRKDCAICTASQLVELLTQPLSSRSRRLHDCMLSLQTMTEAAVDMHREAIMH